MAEGTNRHDGHHGRHRDFDKACEQAYQAARDAGLEPPYQVDVHLTGENPFTGYLVVVRPGG
jgi:hypothetical protein